MKKLLVKSIFLLVLFGCPLILTAETKNQTSLSTYFQWKYPSTNPKEQLITRNSFEINQGEYQISGPKQLQETAKQLLAFLTTSEKKLAKRFHLLPGNRQILIRLFVLDKNSPTDVDLSIFSEKDQRLVFPFPIVANTDTSELISSFAVFNLFHSIVKVKLAFGDTIRYPVSSHAFRFIDGLSGYLALEVMSDIQGINKDQFLLYLDHHSLKIENARRYSPAQILSQNSSSETTGILSGLGQFISGISLTRDSDKVTSPLDSSTAADRIRVFQLIEEQKPGEGIQKVMGYLSRSSNIWNVKEQREDSFCVKNIGTGCKDRSIDGTRADILLYHSIGANYAELLQQVKINKTNNSLVLNEGLPAYPVYGFDFPKAGGANEIAVNVLLHHNRTHLNETDYLDEMDITMNGLWISLGFRDEAYQGQFEFRYATGKHESSIDFISNSVRYKLPIKVVHTDMQIGSRVIERGYQTGWVTEMGVYFHWKRLQVEWNTKDLSIKNTDLEYINRGYFLLDIQNYKAIKLAGIIDLGLNYDLQMGLVNQSGSVRLVKNEKYNKDFSNLVLGANIGPEIRLLFPSILLDIRFGTDFNYLWQPIDDEGGKSGGENSVNANQSLSKFYATLGLRF